MDCHFSLLPSGPPAPFLDVPRIILRTYVRDTPNSSAKTPARSPRDARSLMLRTSASGIANPPPCRTHTDHLLIGPPANSFTLPWIIPEMVCGKTPYSRAMPAPVSPRSARSRMFIASSFVIGHRVLFLADESRELSAAVPALRCDGLTHDGLSQS
uniref:Putative bacteriophage t7-related protein n=1 Tax=uncultured marine virus TaxID=186617 RepID=A0A0F7L8D4_9VIRU|nr:putative bacteriophage t7-related protein [uncultured marine virus]